MASTIRVRRKNHSGQNNTPSLDCLDRDKKWNSGRLDRNESLNLVEKALGVSLRNASGTICECLLVISEEVHLLNHQLLLSQFS